MYITQFILINFKWYKKTRLFPIVQESALVSRVLFFNQSFILVTYQALVQFP